MATQSTTFQAQTLRERVHRLGRLFRRMQYPLSEGSEPMFDLERYGASSRHSNSTRHSVSSFRRTAADEYGRPMTQTGTDEIDEDKVDVVVVDHQFSSESITSDENELMGEKTTAVQATEQGSAQYEEAGRAYGAVVARGWLYLQHFFHPVFQDPKKENQYQRESWFLAKRVAIWTTVFCYISWGLLVGLYPRPWHTYDFYAWIGIIGFFVLPLLPAILYDAPKRLPWLWRVYVFGLTWSWPFLMALQLVLCNFYTPGLSTCGKKDFVGLFFYLCAMPTMALFALQQSRLFHLLGTLGGALFIAIAIVPLRHSWVRHLFNFLAFQIFILYISYAREKSDRKIFNLRDQLKIQYKATQKAQVAESKASDSKKRFFNYIFHEVRVPLNTALLSLQNLVGEEVFREASTDSLELVDVLQGSLGMMEKVLNDVLDFHRSSEAGKLIYVSSPFDFSKVIRSVLMGLDIAVANKNVTINSQLDPRIEILGDLIGDEMRLTQVLSNLVSNASKFTASGGSITLKTMLLSPLPQSKKPTRPDSLVGSLNSRLSADNPQGTGAGLQAGRLRSFGDGKVTIRMEVHDTGVGIRPADVKNDRLFSPYVQTEIGKRQGGKGTGLGLALVRNIIDLSGGRLGLVSKAGEGSMFWVEQRFEVHDRAALHAMLEGDDPIKPAVQSSVPIETHSKMEDLAQVTTQKRLADEFGVDSTEQIQPAGSVESLHPERPRLPATPPLTASTVGTLSTFTASQGAVSNLRPHTTGTRHSALQQGSSSKSARPTAASIAMPSPESAAFVESTSSIARTADSPLQILVIDDDLLTRRLMTRMLTRLGHLVESAENGLIALEILRKHWRGEIGQPFDLIFCDNQMPVLSGVEMVNLARMEGIDTMLCGVTGNAMKEDQDEFLDCGADHVLIKPVMEVSVKRMIDLAKERRQEGTQSTGRASTTDA